MAPFSPSRPASRRRLVLFVVAVAALLLPALSGCILLPDRHGALALQSNHVLVGAWLGSWPTDTNPAISQFEKRADVRLDLVDVYLDWFTPVANVSHTLHHIASRGSVAIMSWEAQTITTVDILDGTRELPMRDGRELTIDAYIAEFARGVCTSARLSNQPILLRILHEMNGNWFAWGLSYTEDGRMLNTPDNYKRAWIKLHDAFDSRCGDEVRFVWAVNHFSVPADIGYMASYPGNAYVDYIGIDGYNWGSNADWGWQGFDTLFRPAYCEVTAATTKPILVAEVASTERGGNKAQWIRDMYDAIEKYDRIRGMVWLNHAKFEVEIEGQMDWPVDSSAASLQAFSEGAKDLKGRVAADGSSDGGC